MSVKTALKEFPSEEEKQNPQPPTVGIKGRSRLGEGLGGRGFNANKISEAQKGDNLIDGVVVVVVGFRFLPWGGVVVGVVVGVGGEGVETCFVPV